MSQTPRHINTSRSLNRPDPAAAAPRHAASSTDAKQSAGGAHNEPPRRPAQGAGQKPPRRRKKKKKMPLWLPFAVVMAIIAVISGVVVYGVSLVNKVEDSIRPDDSTPTIEEEVKTAEEYKGDVVNILVCGIDYEEGRNYSNDPTSNDGMTDMILYVQFDIKNGALRMLQIPRNSLVATQNRKITLSNGKTYSATNYQINSVSHLSGRFVCKCYSQYIKRIHPLMIHEIGNPVCYHSCLSASCTGKYEKWSIHMLTSLLLHIIKSCHNSSCINKKRHYVYTKHMFHFICSV